MEQVWQILIFPGTEQSPIDQGQIHRFAVWVQREKDKKHVWVFFFLFFLMKNTDQFNLNLQEDH